MTPADVPVALLGFSDTERQALVARFQRDARAQPARYTHVLSLEDARFVVVDGDKPGVRPLLEQLGRIGDAVFVGDQAPRGAAGWLVRPVTPDEVLRELDRLLLRQARPAAARRPPDAARATRLPPATSPATSLLRPARPLVVPRALLVDDSEIALHFLRRELKPYGLDVDSTRFVAQAEALMAERAYGVVFLDVDLGEDGRQAGLALCQRIHHSLRHPGGRVPTVVMVSALSGAVDQVRGSLAGADAYLGKPLDRSALDLVLRRLGFRAPVLPPAAAGSLAAVPAAPRPGR